MESQEMFAVEMFGNTGRAIEFTLENADRVFLFIQDSSRYKSRILTDWRAIRPAPSFGLDRTLAGPFYTYVIDAFAPEAGAIFAGFGFFQ